MFSKTCISFLLGEFSIFHIFIGSLISLLYELLIVSFISRVQVCSASYNLIHDVDFIIFQRNLTFFLFWIINALVLILSLLFEVITFLFFFLSCCFSKFNVIHLWIFE